MSEEQLLLTMIRMLPMVEALHDEAFMHAHQGGGDSPSYFVARLNKHVGRLSELSGDDLVSDLRIDASADVDKAAIMQQVAGATAELKAYLRQRIGFSEKGGSSNFNLAPNYTGCHFAAGVPDDRGGDEDEV